MAKSLLLRTICWAKLLCKTSEVWRVEFSDVLWGAKDLRGFVLRFGASQQKDGSGELHNEHIKETSEVWAEDKIRRHL